MSTLNAYTYNKWLFNDFTYFTASEFRCGCKKCANKAFPHKVNAKLLTYLEQLRTHFDAPVIITSGLRCSNYNASLPGSVKNSKHKTGMAADIVVTGVSASDVHKYWQSLKVGYSYYGTANMGNACHVQIGW